MKAPDFNLPDQNGKMHALADYKGKWLVVYFYPKDFTPGCTKEACGFRDASGEFTKRGIKIVGISKDSVSSHKKFIQKYNLNFTLLADPEHTVIESYGAWRRNTYLINPKGEIVKEYKKVDPISHASQILKDVGPRQYVK